MARSDTHPAIKKALAKVENVMIPAIFKTCFTDIAW
jgi:hypothetical protein